MKQLQSHLSDIISTHFDVEMTPVLTRPDAQFGDFSTNIALQLAGKLGGNPREIAGLIVDELRKTGAYETVSLAGPGFINVTLSGHDLLELLQDTAVIPDTTKQVVIETNNPNPFKAMHIGHAFNAILADTVANLLEYGSAAVHRVSYHGDVGAHVGKSMWAILGYINGDVQKLIAIEPSERNTFMSKMYAEGAKAYKESESVKAAIDELAKESFTQDDPLYKQVYDMCKEWSFEQIDSIVARLGNRPIEKRYLESQADPVGVATVKEHVGSVFTESDGALVFDGSKYGSFDNAFVASNGRGLYAARDLGLMQLKNNDFHPDKSYIVTAEEQRAYFKGVIAAAGQCLPELAEQTVNISTGTVKLSTGKMSSRSGDVVEISWLFEQFKQAIADRGGEPTDEIAAGAMRYQFLKVKIGSDVVFDVSEAVSLQGNTGSYLQYAHARARRILEKSDVDISNLTNVLSEDRSLVRKLGEYHEIVARANNELAPHHICTYLFELAQDFNRYYETNQVIGSEVEGHRLALVKTYADTLKQGLGLLGIIAPDSM
jgi:arginyl-tRNA synthetase